MKKLLMLVVVLIGFLTNLQAQNSIKTTLESGIYEKIEVTFSYDSTEISTHTRYIKWLTDDFLREGNINWKNKQKEIHPNYNTVELFIEYFTGSANITQKFKCKNMPSYTPINAPALVFVSNGKIIYSFAYKAQNGYGNYIIGKSFYTVED